MKLRDFQFFLAALVGMAVTTALFGHASAQDNSLLFRQAVEKFGGPSRIALNDSSNTSLRSWKAPDAIVEQSVVLDWNERELIVIRPDSIDQVLVPSPRVLNVQVHWQNPAAEQLVKLLQKRHYAEAMALGTRLLSVKEEGLALPRWQQRVAISLLVQSSIGTDRWERAALLYLSLAKSQSPPLLLSTIPIPWSSSSVEIRERLKMQELAQVWIVDANEAIQLLGAAWLLDGNSRNEAVGVLQRLTRESSTGWVRQYAESQLWRTVAPNQITSEELDRWTALRDSIPLPMQAGPTYLLADRLAAGSQNTRAIEEWLRILALHEDRPVLFDQAKGGIVPLLQSVDDTQSLEQVRALGSAAP